MTSNTESSLTSAQSSPASKTHHLDWVNYAKGIGIALVVVGHTLRGLFEGELIAPVGLPSLWDDWIYTFHMPLFFFISGLFIQASLQKSVSRFFVKRLKFVVYPYLLWSWIYLSFQMILSFLDNASLNLHLFWQIIYQPTSQFWFLYVLLFVSLIYVVFAVFKLPHWVFFGFSIIAAIPYLWDLDLWDWGVLSLVSKYMFYFALGTMIGRHQLIKFEQIKSRYLAIATVAGFGLIFANLYFNWLPDRSFSLGFAVLGIISCITCALLCARTKQLPFLVEWGKLSLEIYVMHTLPSAFLRISLMQGFNYFNPWGHLGMGILAGLFLPIAVKRFCDRVQFNYLFTWGGR